MVGLYRYTLPPERFILLYINRRDLKQILGRLWLREEGNDGLWFSSSPSFAGLLFGQFSCPHLANPLELLPVDPCEVGRDQKDQNGYDRKHGKGFEGCRTTSRAEVIHRVARCAARRAWVVASPTAGAASLAHLGPVGSRHLVFHFPTPRIEGWGRVHSGWRRLH